MLRVTERGRDDGYVTKFSMGSVKKTYRGEVNKKISNRKPVLWTLIVSFSINSQRFRTKSWQLTEILTIITFPVLYHYNNMFYIYLKILICTSWFPESLAGGGNLSIGRRELSCNRAAAQNQYRSKQANNSHRGDFAYLLFDMPLPINHHLSQSVRVSLGCTQFLTI